MEDKGVGEGNVKGLAGDVGVGMDVAEGLCKGEGEGGRWRARASVKAFERAWMGVLGVGKGDGEGLFEDMGKGTSAGVAVGLGVGVVKDQGLGHGRGRGQG